ncbi:transcription factor domain protein [Aspergillus clavatus NRRL 1]|uniref:Fungal specific transcription factor domain protein n=1 Tax=Aspergillus clavatus (strain ATCC 1007 / CBS 513.65 / DSM 816 / NCTC 3887 / NRRL 1 / QM 1276 / 107) TaxID=344612 RepID=A1CLL5_ASPCL|nr:fungal specific transcription factor domain protein [Aspergillus clavatus NRRL 1]EAW10039.1 fungal specific transcription factor domain protein [Aspergillus clavatus NRRL 1]
MSAQKSPAISPVEPIPARPSTKQTKVMACIFCQQRKIRCDREFPCVNCMRAWVPCVPAAGPRPRRRRFPERELLERVRRYEALLREHHIPFDPLHPSSVEVPSPGTNEKDSDVVAETTSGSPGTAPHRSPSERSSVKGETTSYEAKNFWHLMNHMTLENEGEDNNGEGYKSSFSHDDVRETAVKKAWDAVYPGSNHNILFGSAKANLNISALHPSQLHIVKVWQIYLDNVNPLLKVTHTPTLQPSLIDAAGDVTNISPTLEALMFSIYSVSILSLSDKECFTTFKARKEDLLRGYQFGCEQALLNCRVLQTGSRECLTALFLYLVSVRPVMDPRSLYSMLGSAIRIAQRMGLDNKAMYAQCSALEGEMRRRLWWSIVIFDNRICEMSHHKTTMLIPTWDCLLPLNVNDFDIQPGMKDLPPSHDKPTEAVFAAVRSEMAQFIRYSAFHLDFTSPSLKRLTQSSTGADIHQLERFENDLEDKYLAFCNPDNPLHFMTLWTARGQLTKNRLMEHYSRYASVQQTDAQRNSALGFALQILECDTKIMTSPLTQRYLWLAQFHLPFPAYLHILTDLKKRPITSLAEKVWTIMSDNYEARFANKLSNPDPFFDFLCTLALQAWEACEAVAMPVPGSRPLHGPPMTIPRIVADIKQTMPQFAPSDALQRDYPLNLAIDDFFMSMPMDSVGPELGYGLEGQGLPEGDFFQPTVDARINQADWTMSWYPRDGRNL